MSLRSIKQARLHPVNVNRSRRPRQRIGSSRAPLELREQGCARPQRLVRVCAEYHSDHGTEANRRSLLKSGPYGTLRLVLGSPTTSPFRSRPGISVFRLGGDCSGFGIPACPPCLPPWSCWPSRSFSFGIGVLPLYEQQTRSPCLRSASQYGAWLHKTPSHLGPLAYAIWIFRPDETSRHSFSMGMIQRIAKSTTRSGVSARSRRRRSWRRRASCLWRYGNMWPLMSPSREPWWTPLDDRRWPILKSSRTGSVLADPGGRTAYPYGLKSRSTEWSRPTERCPPQAGYWSSGHERRPNVRLIWRLTTRSWKRARTLDTEIATGVLFMHNWIALLDPKLPMWEVPWTRCAKSTPRLHLRPKARRVRRHQTRTAPPLRYRARDRPPQGRRSRRPLLSQRSRRRRRQRHPLRRRI